MAEGSRRRIRVEGIAVLPVAVVVSLGALALGLLSAVWRQSAGASDGTITIGVAADPSSRAVPPGFLGLSLELPSIEAYAGSDPASLDPVFVQLIRNLTPGQSPVLRIGGDSADWSWWPVPGMPRPAGVAYTLTPVWLQVTRALQQALGARLILGVNLETDDATVAGAETRALTSGLGPEAVSAFELGNEPELYGIFPWYRTARGEGIPGRPRDYGFPAFSRDFARIAASLGDVPLAGPATGGTGWIHDLTAFLAQEPRLAVVAVHRYPLQLCFTRPGSPSYPSVAHLMAPASSRGLAESFAEEVAVAHAHRLPLRIDELNTVSCGADPAVSQTFASALWALDTMFELVRVGVDGVNIHTYPGAGYELFRIAEAGGGWRAAVAPEYYGLLMFAQAAPAGSRLLPISGGDGGAVRTWATRGPDGTIRIVLINDDVVRGHQVLLRVPGHPRPAVLERLQAPSVVASSGVTLAGRSFGAATSTGSLSGRSRADILTPGHGELTIRLAAASAAMVTLRPPAPGTAPGSR